ncbi:unnamed protein product [Clavelina lepadiformis]|uniref:U3 small nucleolar RNA-associated protein 6 homolog n=1 Tax=Clavelina lepadiformis TaxID=159417 RepID=A0ABP0GLP0_CLALP
MSEYVHRHTEEMLPELEQLQRVGLFSSQEIKAIIKKRTAHEYKLVRRMKDKKDFVSYVQYEINLLALIHKRRGRENYFFKKDEIEYAIVSRIHGLFKKMIFRWPHDLKLWMSHAKFCIKWKKKIQLSKLCTNLLQIHGNKPHMWVLAAKWEMECGDSMDKARALFMQAVKLHPDNKKVWWEFFRAELLFAEKLRRRLKLLTSDENVENVEGSEQLLMSGQAAKIAYRHAVGTISDDVTFHAKFMDIVLDFVATSAFATDVLEEVRQDLKEKFPTDPVVHSTLAKLHLNPKYDKVNSSKLPKTSPGLDRFDRVFSTFEDAVAEVDTQEMWGEYIDCLLSLCGSDAGSNETLGAADADTKPSILQQALKIILKAHNDEKVSADRYPKIIEFLINQGFLQEAEKLADDVCKVKVDAKLLLKKLQLTMLLAIDDDSYTLKTDSLFKEILKHRKMMSLKQELEFWSTWVQWAIAIDDEEQAKNVATKLCVGCRPEALISMQDIFLKWVAVKRGVLASYQIFKSEMCDLRTPSLQLFQSVLHMLTAIPDVKSKSVQDCFEQALSAHGLNCPDLWLQYIGFCQKTGGSLTSKAGELHWRAMKNLKPDLTESFIASYTLLGVQGHV